MANSNDFYLTAREREYFGPLLDSIDSGYTRFKLVFASGDEMIAEFCEYNRTGDEFEIFFMVEQMLRNKTGMYGEFLVFPVTMSYRPVSYEVLG